jgi:hypothetical protein
VNLKRIIPDDGAWPDALHQIIFGDKLTSRPDQDLDDLKRTVAEGYGRTARPKLTSAEIDLPWLARVDQIWNCSGHPELWVGPAHAADKRYQNTVQPSSHPWRRFPGD